MPAKRKTAVGSVETHMDSDTGHLIDPVFRDWAKRLLHTALNVRPGRVSARCDLDDWALQFKLLTDRLTAPRVAKTLDWYCRNARVIEDSLANLYMPEAFSARAFCEKFEKLEAAAGRVFWADLSIEPTDRAKRVAANMAAHVGWPSQATKNSLPKYIQLTAENLELTKRTLRAIADQARADTDRICKGRSTPWTRFSQAAAELFDQCPFRLAEVFARRLACQEGRWVGNEDCSLVVWVPAPAGKEVQRELSVLAGQTEAGQTFFPRLIAELKKGVEK